jgi:hypothetical protein
MLGRLLGQTLWEAPAKKNDVSEFLVAMFVNWCLSKSKSSLTRFFMVTVWPAPQFHCTVLRFVRFRQNIQFPSRLPLELYGTILHHCSPWNVPQGTNRPSHHFFFSPFLLGLLGGRALFNNTISACSMTIAGRIEPKQAQVFLPTSLGRYHATGRRKLRCLQELLRLLRSCRGEFATSLKEFSAGRAICFFLAHWFAFTRTLIDITYDDITYTYCFNCLHAFYLCSLCWHSLEFCWADCHVR